MPPLNNFQKSCVALAIGQALAVQGASAATITVTGTDAAAGDCTLHDAITSMNDGADAGNCVSTGVFGTDTIILPAGEYSYSDPVAGYYGPAALPAIGGEYESSDITLKGDDSGTTVIERSGTLDAFRLLTVEDGSSLTLTSITLQNGSSDYGGAIYGYNAMVTIEDSVIDGNYGSDTGGGIFLVDGYLSLIDSTVSNNTADGYGGGISGYDSGYGSGPSLTIIGGAISDNTAVEFDGAGISVLSGDLQLTGTTLQNNLAYSGAAIYVADSTVTLNTVTLQSNTATGYCGAMQIENSTVELLASTFAQNTSDGNGGAICLNESIATITESVLSANISSNGNGGAIYSAFTEGGGSTATVDRSAVSNNSAYSGGGMYIKGGDLTLDKSTLSGNSAYYSAGGVFVDSANFTMINSTLSGNIAAKQSALGISLNAYAADIYSSTIYDNSATGMGADAVAFYAGILPTVYNTIVAGNNGPDCGGLLAGVIANNDNWFGDASCDGYAQGWPRLNPLGDNNENPSYTTLTHAPSLSSPVLDAGGSTYCVVDDDQRGAAREDGNCDIGAVEGGIEGPADAACFVVKAANGNVITFCL